MTIDNKTWILLTIVFIYKSIYTLEHSNCFSHPLYPITEPITEGYLPVSSTHTLFFATYGNSNGIPIVVCHGGPGEGCSNLLTRFFDLNRYYVVMFDQRGSNRSIPFASMEENNPKNSVSDIELLRKFLNIEKWLVFGGSWGSTLALLYGQTHPEHCEGFILRGVFLGRKKDYLHLLYGMGRLAPHAYEAFLNYIPKEERIDLLSAYYKRIMDPDPSIYMPASKAFIEFDTICAYFSRNELAIQNILSNEQAVYNISKHFFYYAMNQFFLEPNQILLGMDKIKNLPAIIVHGMSDIVTLPENAYALHQNWDASILWMISNGGHTSIESGIGSALATALDLFADMMTKPCDASN